MNGTVLLQAQVNVTICPRNADINELEAVERIEGDEGQSHPTLHRTDLHHETTGGMTVADTKTNAGIAQDADDGTRGRKVGLLDGAPKDTGKSRNIVGKVRQCLDLCLEVRLTNSMGRNIQGDNVCHTNIEGGTSVT